MKKSEMMVTMPMSAYEELMKYKGMYEGLTKDLADCFDKVELNGGTNVYFFVGKSLKVAERFKPTIFNQYPVTVLT